MAFHPFFHSGCLEPLSSGSYSRWGAAASMLYAASYLDDVIHSNSWAEHVREVLAVLEADGAHS